MTIDTVEEETLGDMDGPVGGATMDDDVFEDEINDKIILTGKNLEKSLSRRKRRENMTDLLRWGQEEDKDDLTDDECMLDFLIQIREEVETEEATDKTNVVREVVARKKKQSRITDWTIKDEYVKNEMKVRSDVKSDAEVVKVVNTSVAVKKQTLLLQDLIMRTTML